MKKTIKVIYILVITIVFIAVICYLLAQQSIEEIPYIYLEF